MDREVLRAQDVARLNRASDSFLRNLGLILGCRGLDRSVFVGKTNTDHFFNLCLIVYTSLLVQKRF